MFGREVHEMGNHFKALHPSATSCEVSMGWPQSEQKHFCIAVAWNPAGVSPVRHLSLFWKGPRCFRRCIILSWGPVSAWFISWGKLGLGVPPHKLGQCLVDAWTWKKGAPCRHQGATSPSTCSCALLDAPCYWPTVGSDLHRKMGLYPGICCSSTSLPALRYWAGVRKPWGMLQPLI